MKPGLTNRAAMFIIEAMTGFVILCGTILVIAVCISRAGDVSAVTAGRMAAAERLGEVIDGVRAGAVEVKLGGEISVPPTAGESPALTCAIRADDRPEDPGMARVAVNVTWRTSGRDMSLSAETLVRKSRLKLAPPGAAGEKGGAP